MVYLDNAATTYIKPNAVYKAAGTAFANSGRGGHKLALKASLEIENVRSLLADFFCVPEPENIAFCPNTTFALNYAIHGLLHKGDHIIISGMEHNSVARPAIASGAEVSIAEANKDGFVSVASVEKEIRLNTKMIAITHASNVTGTINPITEIGALAKNNGIIFLVDAAQTGGILPISVAENNIDLLAFPSHKHLFGVQGSGGLYVHEDLEISPIIQGGTGTHSLSLEQPLLMPNSLEAGTQNAAAIVALGKGIEFLNSVGKEEILQHEQCLTNYLLERLLNMKNIIVYGTKEAKKQVGTVSFNIFGKDCVEISNILSTRYNIATRAGFHCCGLAHKSLGTEKSGTFRASISYFTKKSDIDKLISAILKMN